MYGHQILTIRSAITLVTLAGYGCNCYGSDMDATAMDQIYFYSGLLGCVNFGAFSIFAMDFAIEYVRIDLCICRKNLRQFQLGTGCLFMSGIQTCTLMSIHLSFTHVVTLMFDVASVRSLFRADAGGGE